MCELNDDYYDLTVTNMAKTPDVKVTVLLSVMKKQIPLK